MLEVNIGTNRIKLTVLFWAMVSIASTGFALCTFLFAPASQPVSNMVPHDALQVVGTFGIIGAIGALVAALATGLRARGSAIPRPPGFPPDHCAEVPRLINAYNVLKEVAQRPHEVEPGAEAFAVNLYLQAVGRKQCDDNTQLAAKPDTTSVSLPPKPIGKTAQTIRIAESQAAMLRARQAAAGTAKPTDSSSGPKSAAKTDKQAPKPKRDS